MQAHNRKRRERPSPEKKSKGLMSTSSKTFARLAKGVFFKAPFYLIRFLCLVAFLIQTSTLINGMLNPKETLIGTNKVDFEKIEFPLIFKICIKPGFNDTELRNLGYLNSLTYLLGISRYNISNFGELIRNVRTSRFWKDWG